MKVLATKLLESSRVVHCPHGGFASHRILLAQDGLGFSLHKTVIPKGPPQHWHYKNHQEACYCVSGLGELIDLGNGKKYRIEPDTTYVLDNYDNHTFQAIEDVVLISIFNPPVTGGEVHDADGSYPFHLALSGDNHE